LNDVNDTFWQTASEEGAGTGDDTLRKQFTKEQLIKAYEEGGSFDRAAYILEINRKTFGKLWRDLIGAAPPRSAKTDRRRRKRLEDGEVHKAAFISDLHYGSRYHAEDEFHDFIKLIRRRGVDTLLCAGDLSDGLNMHEGMEHEQYLHKPKDIVNYIVDNYPKGFERNVFITGNHDISLQRSGCVDLGLAVAERRPDLTYLGHDMGELLAPGGLEVVLFHGSSGCSDIRSKRAQDLAFKIAVERRGKVPNVLATGHCHMENWTPQYMNMSIMSLGCFQRQTPHLATKMLKPDVSGAVLTYQVIGGKLINPTLESIQYDC
jgi:predicted phosphodiesterase